MRERERVRYVNKKILLCFRIALLLQKNLQYLAALALGNANVKCKENLALAPKTLASENCKRQY